MSKPTFEEQYQKIVSAYYKNELRPLETCACFIGNLLNNNAEWGTCADSDNIKFWDYYTDEVTFDYKRHGYQIRVIDRESNGLYSSDDITRLENNFLRICYRDTYGKANRLQLTEESLFEAMESTLQMLREVHESKGEVVKNYNFTRRESISI